MAQLTDTEIRAELDRQAKMQTETARRQTLAPETPDFILAESRKQTQLLQKISNDLHLVYLVFLWSVVMAFVGLLFFVASCLGTFYHYLIGR